MALRISKARSRKVKLDKQGNFSRVCSLFSKHQREKASFRPSEGKMIG